MKTLFSFLSAIFISLSLLSQSKKETPVEPSCAYTELNLDSSDFSSFSIFDSLLPQKSVFIIGEDHSYRRSNTQLQIRLLKYLHQKAGVRTLLFEFGPSIGWMVNHYIQTGDSSYYHSFRNYAFVDFQKFYEQLREFNATLDSANKINVVGIDMERSLASAAKYMNLLLPKDKEIPAAIQLNIESLRGIGAYLDKYYDEYQSDSAYEYVRPAQYFSTKRTLDIFIDDFQKNDSLYKLYLGKDYVVFKTVVDGIIANTKWEEYQEKNAYQEWVFREQYMYQRFEELVMKNPGQKYFGSFGRCHTSLNEQSEWCGLYYFKSLMRRINSSSSPALKDKVLSIGSYYPRSVSSVNYGTHESDYLDELIAFSKEDAVMVYKVFCDTASTNDLKNKFHYIIVNKRNPDKESWEMEKSATFDDYVMNGDDVRFSFNLNYGALSGNLLNLNTYIHNNFDPLVNFNNYLPFAGGGWLATDDHFCYGFNYRYYLHQTKTLANADVLNLHGYSFQSMWGGDFFKTPVFDFIASGGVGYGVFKLKQNTSAVNGAAIFGSPTDYEYSNRIFTFLGEIDMRVNIKWVSVGFQAGYQQDVSNASWRSEELIATSPATRLSGWYGTLNLSVFFQEDGYSVKDDDY
ncbi:MAG: erythromycin esterase family protein [Flavobacteriales bacterium]